MTTSQPADPTSGAMMRSMTYHSKQLDESLDPELLMPADVREALTRWRRSAKARRVYFKHGWPASAINAAVVRDRQAYIDAVAKWEDRENNPTLF